MEAKHLAADVVRPFFIVDHNCRIFKIVLFLLSKLIDAASI
jgi:hypothetical protein